jgi:hypothetical protein
MIVMFLGNFKQAQTITKRLSMVSAFASEVSRTAHEQILEYP